MTNINFRLHETNETISGQGENFVAAVINLLQAYNACWCGDREYCEELFERISALAASKDNEVSRFDFSTPEDNYTLTLTES